MDRPDHVRPPGVRRDGNGLPIISAADEGLRVLAVACDAVARRLFGRPYTELDPSWGEVAYDVAVAVCDAVTAAGRPEAN